MPAPRQVLAFRVLGRLTPSQTARTQYAKKLRLRASSSRPLRIGCVALPYAVATATTKPVRPIGKNPPRFLAWGSSIASTYDGSLKGSAEAVSNCRPGGAAPTELFEKMRSNAWVELPFVACAELVVHDRVKRRGRGKRRAGFITVARTEEGGALPALAQLADLDVPKVDEALRDATKTPMTRLPGMQGLIVSEEPYTGVESAK